MPCSTFEMLDTISLVALNDNHGMPAMRDSTSYSTGIAGWTDEKADLEERDSTEHASFGTAHPAAAQNAQHEPTRRLRPAENQLPAPKPKRFFRTFWCGITMRAVALHKHRSANLCDVY